jgi:23S rRNA maturation-related 3'-5' exoribonuclease YhaM
MKVTFRAGTRFLGAIFLVASVGINANTITCGLKTVTLNGNTITKIVHEDGTVHAGASISQNWTYNGKSITHRLMNDPIPCGTAPKTRDEIIAELSGRFTKNPKSFGMTSREAELMVAYTAKLMRTDSACYLLVDAQKSTSKPGMFFIDCNNKQAVGKRYWVSINELEGG